MRRLLLRWLSLRLAGEHSHTSDTYLDHTPATYTRTTRVTHAKTGRNAGCWQVDRLHPFGYPTKGRVHFDLLDAIPDWGVGGEMGGLLARLGTCVPFSHGWAIHQRNMRVLAAMPELVNRYWLFE